MPSSEVAMRRQEEKNRKLETWLYEEDDDEEVEADEVQDDALKPVEAPKPVPWTLGQRRLKTTVGSTRPYTPAGAHCRVHLIEFEQRHRYADL
jgi:hypothetical protein